MCLSEYEEATHPTPASYYLSLSLRTPTLFNSATLCHSCLDNDVQAQNEDFSHKMPFKVVLATPSLPNKNSSLKAQVAELFKKKTFLRVICFLY